MRSFLKRREVRNFFQINRSGQRRAVLQMLNDAAIVGLEKILQHQAGKQLMLCKLFRTELMTVRW